MHVPDQSLPKRDNNALKFGSTSIHSRCWFGHLVHFHWSEYPSFISRCGGCRIVARGHGIGHRPAKRRNRSHATEERPAPSLRRSNPNRASPAPRAPVLQNLAVAEPTTPQGACHRRLVCGPAGHDWERARTHSVCVRAANVAPATLAGCPCGPAGAVPTRHPE